MLNQEIYVKDPLENQLANNGVDEGYVVKDSWTVRGLI